MPGSVSNDAIKRIIEDLPEIAEWADLVNVFDRAGSEPRPDWQIPVIACQSAGGDPNAAVSAAAAIACLQISIILADDLLDNDPRGEHIRRGPGTAANLALAFQAACFRVLESAGLGDKQRAAANSSLTRAALATAYGQQLDDQSLPGEENYWQVVQAKSTPFYGTAYELGAIFAGASEETAAGLRAFGILVGEMIQIEDDIGDALEQPANPDWLRGSNNLLIIFALEADYDQKHRFSDLLKGIQEQNSENLSEAQRILIESGALSYAVFHLVQRYQEAWRLLHEIDLYDPEPLIQFLNEFGLSLVELLKQGGVEVDLEMLRRESLQAMSNGGDHRD